LNREERERETMNKWELERILDCGWSGSEHQYSTIDEDALRVCGGKIIID
jgi:hypothetical protein